MSCTKGRKLELLCRESRVTPVWEIRMEWFSWGKCCKNRLLKQPFSWRHREKRKFWIYSSQSWYANFEFCAYFTNCLCEVSVHYLNYFVVSQILTICYIFVVYIHIFLELSSQGCCRVVPNWERVYMYCPCSDGCPRLKRTFFFFYACVSQWLCSSTTINQKYWYPRGMLGQRLLFFLHCFYYVVHFKIIVITSVFYQDNNSPSKFACNAHHHL